MDNLTSNFVKPQGYHFSPVENFHPIAGITRIDAPWHILFYVMVWTMIPPAYDLQKPKSINRQVAANYAREFKRRAKLAGVAVGHKAGVKRVFELLQHGTEKSIPHHDKARALMATHLYKQFTDGEQ
jgi:hypothetical protein